MRKTFLRNARRSLIVAVGALVALFVSATAAFAQFSGEDAEIPENPPTNWTTGWLGWPLLVVICIIAVGILIYYGVKLVRLRYPTGD